MLDAALFLCPPFSFAPCGEVFMLSPDSIFRRFSEANALNLLSLQAEITSLEDELKELSKADR